MQMVMFFRAGLSDIFVERGRAKTAVDAHNLDDLEIALRRMNAVLGGMIAEAEHQQKLTKEVD